METGGLSVADLVQRHTGSRPNIPIPPATPPAPVQPVWPAEEPAWAPGAARPVDSSPSMRAPSRPAETSGTWQQANVTRSATPPRAAQPPQATPQRTGQRPAPKLPPTALGQRTGSGPRPAPPPQNGVGLPAPVNPANRRTPQIPRQAPGRSSMPPRPNGAPGTSSMPPRPNGVPGTRSLPPQPNGVPGNRSLPPQPNGGPGNRSLPPRPNGAPGTTSMPPRATSSRPAIPLPPPRQPVADAERDIDLVGMTTEMEAVGEATQKRRQVDHTLARFSKVHDELKAEERARKAKRKKLFPWAATDDELDHLDEIVGLQSPGAAVPQAFHEDAPPPERAPAPQDTRSKSRHRSALAGKAFAAAAAVLVFLATGAAWGFKKWVEDGQQQVDALAGGYAVQDPAAQRGDENFLLVGSDVRPGAEAEETGVIGARSDTVMIAHIPANRERAVVVSLPRDTEVNRPQCEIWDSNTNSYTGQQDPGAKNVKLNSAFAVGGPKCVTKMVQELTGLEINHFVGINFDGFKGMVDAVGGVEVCVERPMRDEELGVIVPEAGKNVTITGDQALNFVRARSVRGDKTADYGRIKRQQRFLSSLLRKAMSSEVLLDPGKLTDFVDAFSKSTYGDNIGVEQLMLLGQSMQGLQAGRVTFATVPTVGDANTRGNEVLRKEDTDALFKAIRDDAPLPGEEPAQGGTGQQAQPGGTQQGSQPAQAAPVDPKTIKIQVLNGGNSTTGIARRTAEKLGGFGFQVMQVESAPAVPQTVVRYAKGKEAAAQTLAASIPGAQLQEDPSLAGALLLVIGPEYKGDVVAPQAAAKLPEDLSTVNAADVDCA